MTEQYVEELIRKYADGTATDEEIQEIMHWYRSASINEVTWLSANPGEKQHVYSRMLDRLQNEISPKRSRVINYSWLRIAAILVIFLGVAFMIYFEKPFSKSYITITNPSGKIQLVNLPDSSRVWLNASTSLRYLKSFKGNREVELEGEAYFEVTHDAQYPFNVGAGGVQTTVLGTSFNVKAYKSKNITTVSVISGKVRVRDNSKEVAVITPSIQLQFDRQNKTAKTVAIDTNSVLAWKMGRLQFQGETLSEIASTLESWYGIKIVFANAGMRACRYYMNFDNTMSLGRLLSTMSEITEMQYALDKNGRTVTLSGGECLAVDSR